jgi:hydrogenase nickel incorporation protein HypA/HybF
MHEIGLAGAILDIVERAARTDPFRCVRRLRLSVPARAAVEPDALDFALRAIAPGTLLEGAEIVLDRPPEGATLRVVELLVE